MYVNLVYKRCTRPLFEGVGNVAQQSRVRNVAQPRFYDYLLIPLAGKLEVCRVSPSLVAALNLTTERLGLPLAIRTRNIEPSGLGGGPVYRSTVLPYSDAAPLTP